MESLDQKNYGLRLQRLSISIFWTIFNNSYRNFLNESFTNSELLNSCFVQTLRTDIFYVIEHNMLYLLPLYNLYVLNSLFSEILKRYLTARSYKTPFWLNLNA